MDFTKLSVVVLVLVFNVDDDVVEVAFVIGDDVVDVVLEVGAVLDVTGQEAAALLYMSAMLHWPFLYLLAANLNVSAVLMRQKKAKAFNIQSTTIFIGGVRIIV